MADREIIERKSAQEIDIMRRAGHLLQRVILEVAAAVQPGVTTGELDKLAKARIVEAGAKPAFLGQYGFPKTMCISVNEEVVHGIPGKRKLEEGDIVSLDCGVILKGFYADTAYTVAVGKCSEQAQKLMDVTREALNRAIAQCQPGNRLGDIGWAVQSYVEAQGFSVVEEYGGHGIGRALHEDPRIENLGPPGKRARLLPGMVIAVEPMVNIGTGKTKVLGDQWTVVSADGSLSAHYEHTVAILESGPEILTLAQ